MTSISSHSVPSSCEQLLCRMIAYETVSTEISGRPDAESAIIGFLESLAHSWGLGSRRLPVDKHAPNLLIWHEADPSFPWLTFDSHLDTVSTEGMTIDPLKASIKGGRLFGRGSCDTKASGAAMLWALKEMAGNTHRSTNVAILFSVSEETTQAGAAAFVDHHMQTLGWKPLGIIVGEPTMMCPVIATHGVMRWRIRTRGISAHSSTPELGRSAISDMVRVIDMLENTYAPSLTATHPLTGKARFSINVIAGGSQVNVIPEACTIEIDRRLVPGESSDKVLPSVGQMLDQLSRECSGMRVTQETPFIMPPLDPEQNRGFAGAVCGVLTRHGFEGEPCGTPYATNASSFCRAGVPAVVLGPGDIAQAHTHDEWIDVAQIRRGFEGYHALMTAPAETWT
jgi:acetylornithine deacetylase/succinyl-diaminopimelate desuccinylase-like protein